MVTFSRSGLTLIEVLAALVIISAAVTTAISILSDVRASAVNHDLQRKAHSIVELWDVSDRPGPIWEHTDEQEVMWRVLTAEPIAPATPLTSNSASAIPPLLAAWQTITIEAQTDDGFESLQTLHGLTKQEHVLSETEDAS